MFEKLGKIDKAVFIVSFLICAPLTVAGFLYPEAVGTVANGANNFVTKYFGWWYLIAVAIFLGFLVWCAASKYGHIRLGKDDEKPEHSLFSWFAMLFNAGIGVGFVYYSVAEPLNHIMQPLASVGAPGSPEAVENALRLTVTHWGIHGWCTFTVVGLAIAYFSYRLGRPMTIATGLMGVLGENPEEKPLGKIINILTVFATIFGSATCLGIGVLQVRYGLNLLFNIPINLTTSIIVVTIISFLFILSAVRGIDKGIKILSDSNLWLAIGLLIFIFLLGPTRFILDSMVTTTGLYLDKFIYTTFWADAMNTGGGWLGWWTIFYWAWWIALAPWVGAFLARISRGRTIREFIVGSLLIPTIFTIIWMTVFGGATIHAQLFEGIDIWATAQKDIASGVFTLFSGYPFPWFMGLIIIVSLVIFFVTGADAAAFTVAMIMNKGDLNPTNPMKVFWGIFIALVALVLMIGGGLPALQTASIVSALPFSFAMLVYMYSTVKGLQNDGLIVTGQLPDEIKNSFFAKGTQSTEV